MKKISVLAAFLLASIGAQAAPPLATAVVAYSEVAQTYRAEGLVEATHQTTVAAQISGRVKAVLFEVGDKVKAGQVIVRIDEREAEQALAGSQGHLAQAQANLQNAKVSLARAREMFAQKFISQSALDKAQADFDAAAGQAQATRAGAGQANLARGYTSVTAPYSGVVAARLVEVGETVMPGKPLMTGFDASEMRVIVSIPQYQLDAIGKNPQVLVEIPTQNRSIKAASVTVQPLADSRTHGTQVRVNLPANQAGIYPGMFVRAEFVLGKTKKLLIPASAVLHRSEVVAVYVVDAKGAVQLRQVRLGESSDANVVEVLAGLTAGEQVATDPVKAGMTSRASL
ncbi:MAG: efflux RND transporter periplasmic adaptor subunit [Gallionella sp.]